MITSDARMFRNLPHIQLGWAGERKVGVGDASHKRRTVLESTILLCRDPIAGCDLNYCSTPVDSIPVYRELERLRHFLARSGRHASSNETKPKQATRLRYEASLRAR